MNLGVQGGGQSQPPHNVWNVERCWCTAPCGAAAAWLPQDLVEAPPEEKAQDSVPKRFRSWFVVRLASHTRNSASKNRARGWPGSSPKGLEGRFWNDWPAIRGTELVDTGAWMAPRAVQVGLAGVSHSKRDKRVGIAQSTLKTVQSTLQSTLKTWGNSTVYVKS